MLNTRLILIFTLWVSVVMNVFFLASNATCQSINAFSSSEKKAIVDAHNAIRFDPTLSPPAANMQTMVWDDSLATVAANYVSQCVFDHNAYRGSNVGENIYMGYSQTIGTAAVNSWASEKQYYNFNSGCQSGKICGHYTQLIWASSVKVGCARKTCSTVYENPDFNGATIVVCDYSPAGNDIGQKPYVAGTTNNNRANDAYSSKVVNFQNLLSVIMFIVVVMW